MRDRNYRRKQEAKHYNKRLGLYCTFGKFENPNPKTEDGKIDFKEYEKSKVSYSAGRLKLQNKPNKVKIRTYSPEDVKDEKWTKKLKNGDVKFGLYDKEWKKISNKIRRNLQKNTNYQLKPNRWYDRKDVNPQAHGYNGDSEEEIWHDLLTRGPFECGFFE